MKTLIVAVFLLTSSWSVTSAVNDVDDALRTFENGILNNDRLEIEFAEEFLSKNFTKALQSSLVNHMKPIALLALLSKPWVVDENNVLEAALRWIDQNKPSDELAEAVIENIYLSALSLENLSLKVYPNRLFDKALVLEAYQQKTSSNPDIQELSRIPLQVAKGNVASATKGATVDASCSYGFVLGVHAPDKSCDLYSSSVTVILNKPYVINSVNITVQGDKFYSHGLSLEVSEDRQSWVSVATIQRSGNSVLSFSERSVRYIKVGSSRYSASLLNIEAFYRRTPVIRFFVASRDNATQFGFKDADEALEVYGSETNSQYRQAVRFFSQSFVSALRAESFTKLDVAVLTKLLSNNWIVDEIEVYHALVRWLKSNQVDSSRKRKLLRLVHLCALSLEELSALIEDDVMDKLEILKAFALKTNPTADLSAFMRFHNQFASVNVISEKQLYSLEGGNCSDGFKLGDLDESSTCRVTDELIVTLGASYFLNQIEIYTKKANGVVFSVSVSDDKSNWSSLGNSQSGAMRLNFTGVQVRYIKLTSKGSSFEVVGLRARYAKN